MKFWDTGEEVKTEVFDYNENKRKFIENLDYLKEMSVEEQTLYKKWIEWNADRVSNMKRLPVLQSYYDSLWKPTNLLWCSFQRSELIVEAIKSTKYFHTLKDIRNFIQVQIIQFNIFINKFFHIFKSV